MQSFYYQLLHQFTVTTRYIERKCIKYVNVVPLSNYKNGELKWILHRIGV